MSRFLPILIATIAGLAPLHAQNAATSAPSALTTLRAFGRERGDALLTRVVGMVGFNGQDQPGQWLILQADIEVPNLLHEYAIQGGRIVAQRQFMRTPNQDLPTIPITVSKVAVDSRQAFALANQAAQKAGVGFDSMNYQLRCRDLRNEPVWVLSLMDGARRNVGVIYLSAITGETLRTVWHRVGNMTTSAPPAKQAPQRENTRRGLIPQLAGRISERRNGEANQATDSSAYAIPGGMPQQPAQAR